MEVHMPYYSDATQSEEEVNVRKGPWTAEEDSLLSNYITLHGEGHWNSVARCAGLKRTGKSCRLRWLNYLRPNVRRGNITLQEQLLILELHSRWGNRWSKIAQQLPGRTDNEIKNYWRTRVQKQAKQLKCEVNSKQFRDVMRFVWIPRLVERIQTTSKSEHVTISTNQIFSANEFRFGSEIVDPNTMATSLDMSGTGSQVSPISEVTDCWNQKGMVDGSRLSGDRLEFLGFEESDRWLVGEDSLESLWNDENFWVFQGQE